PHAAKERHAFRFASLERSRIFKTAMKPLCCAWKNRAAFFSVIADGNHIVEALPVKLINMLGAMPADVDAKLAHDGNRFRSHDPRFSAGAFHVERFAGIV